ncbi:MAG: CpsD/CapB family tyrosine-protein kinase [Clostridia bacterium]
MPLSKSLIMYSNRKSPAAEMYRMLRTNIINNKSRSKLQVIAVTSAIKGEGKSTTSANLAIAFAQTDRKVLLIDGDMRGPSIHQIFGISRLGGFSTALKTPTAFHESIKHIEECDIDLMPAGQTMYDPTELLSSKNLPILFEELRKIYDIIIIDTPPVGIITDAALISAIVDGYILVIAEGSSTIAQVADAKKHLVSAGANILGAVFNKMGSKMGKNNYYYKYYYDLYTYGPQYSKGKKKKRKRKAPTSVISSSDTKSRTHSTK